MHTGGHREIGTLVKQQAASVDAFFNATSAAIHFQMQMVRGNNRLHFHSPIGESPTSVCLAVSFRHVVCIDCDVEVARVRVVIGTLRPGRSATVNPHPLDARRCGRPSTESVAESEKLVIEAHTWPEGCVGKTQGGATAPLTPSCGRLSSRSETGSAAADQYTNEETGRCGGAHRLPRIVAHKVVGYPCGR